MRLSANRSSPHYSERGVGRAHVFYEGIPVNGVIELDTDAGWMDVLVTDDAGKFIVEGDSVKVERMFGEITVSFCE
jgi:hypothetical protein